MITLQRWREMAAEQEERDAQGKRELRAEERRLRREDLGHLWRYSPP